MHHRSILLGIAMFALLLISLPTARADDFEVTKERRAAIEKAVPAAKKFLLGSDILKKVEAKKPKTSQEAKAVC